MTRTPELQARLQTVRSHYRVTPWIQPRDDEAPLLRSWQRCRDAGMRDHERISFELVSRAQLAELGDQHAPLVQRARPETTRLAQAVRGSGAAVLLFNQRGVVIDRLCHEAATPAPLLHSTRVGVNLAERCVGTSAPAIALADGLPYLVGRDAHFFDNVRPFFCVAAPIDGPDGQRLGALDITTFDQVPGFDVLSLVVDAAAAIENSLFQASAEQMLVHFHPRAELVGTPMEGLLQLTADGRICGANRMASRLLCTPRSALLGQTFGALFDRRLASLFDPAGRHGQGLVEMHARVGLQVVARIEGEAGGRPVALAAGPSAMAAQTIPPAATTAPAATPADGAASASGEAPAPAQTGPAGRATPSLRALECAAIEQTLAALGGNVSATAKALGISRNTIYRRRQAGPDKAD